MDFDEMQEMAKKVSATHDAIKAAQLDSAKKIEEFNKAKEAAETAIFKAGQKAEIAFQENIEFNLMQGMRGLFEEYGFTNSIVTQMKNKAEREKEEEGVSKHWPWILGGGIFLMFLSGILSGLVLTSYYKDSMSVLAKQLNDAVLIERAWPNLSKADRAKIIDLAAGKTPVAEKSAHNTKK